MTKQTLVITVGCLVVLVAAAILFSMARNRGIITFKDGKPQFSMAALKNPQPSLDRPIRFPADFPENAREMFNVNLAKTKNVLKKNPDDVSAWFDLAIDYRMVGDQEGAVEIWKYVSALHPQEGVSLHNLGEYNFHIAKDYPLAERYYRQSIVVSPQLSANYTDLHEMYRYVYKQDSTAASDILKEGITKIGGLQAIDLMVVLASFYRDMGNTSLARTYYTQARAAAQAAHNAKLVNQLDQEIARLK